MKTNLLFLLVILLFINSSCSSDDSPKDDKLEFIQIRVTSDDITEPSGNVYLFYLEQYPQVKGEPHVNWWSKKSYPYYSYEDTDGEKHDIGPVSAYGENYHGKLLPNKDGYSLHTIYWYELTSLYGIPSVGGRYVVCVFLDDGTYARAYKEFKITKNSIITIHTPTCKIGSEFVEAQWSIIDYE